MSPKTSDIVLGGRFMGLFIGVNGSGKTIAAASFPGDGLIIDFDGRVDPVKYFYPNRTDIDYWTVGLKGDNRRGAIDFTDALKMIEDFQDNCPYDWIVFDSYTSYSATAVFYQMGIRDAKTLKRTLGGLPIPDWDEYKGETSTMMQILEVLKILPCNVIVTGHPIFSAKTLKQGGTTNETLGSMVKASSLSSYGWKTQSFLPNYFNEIHYFYTDVANQPGRDNRYMVRTQSMGEIVAKTALPLPAAFEITGKPYYDVVQTILKGYNLELQRKNEARLKSKLAVVKSKLAEDEEIRS